MNTLAILLLLAADPSAFFAGAKPTWQWDYSTNEPPIHFRMFTNGVAMFDFPAGSFNVVGPAGTNVFLMIGKAPTPMPPGEFKFTLRAVETSSAIESDDSKPLAVRVDPITLKIESASPFKASFSGNKAGQYMVEGQAGIGATWTLLGVAREEPPLSGQFNFVDAEKRTNFFYRVSQ